MSQHVHQFRLLNADTLEMVRRLLDAAPYVDGKTTATDAAKLVKNNFQIDLNDRTVLPQLQQLIGTALVNEPKFNLAFYVSRVYQLLFSKYETGMGYGWHVDAPIMGNPAVRTDLAMTIFLDDPSTYEGGELVIRTDSGERTYKPAAGEAVVYPCQYVHCVNEVKSGQRRAVVTWMQCAVRSAEQRQILADLKSLHETMAKENPQGKETQLLLQSWSNLLRMWGEV